MRFRINKDIIFLINLDQFNNYIKNLIVLS